MDTVVLDETKKKTGEYIATESFNSKKVIASGTDITQVYNAAKSKGVLEPVINYIPEKGVVFIF